MTDEIPHYTGVGVRAVFDRKVFISNCPTQEPSIREVFREWYVNRGSTADMADTVLGYIANQPPEEKLDFNDVELRATFTHIMKLQASGKTLHRRIAEMLISKLEEEGVTEEMFDLVMGTDIGPV